MWVYAPVSNLTDEVCDALAKDIKEDNYKLTIEGIHHILSKQYNYNQLRELEAEFVLENILKRHPDINEDDIDTLFIEKLYAIPAILNMPHLILQSLLAFFNTCLVCNDMPSGVEDLEDIHMLSPRDFHRMFLAVDTMLPDDMFFDEMYIYPNVKRYMYACHKEYDHILLPPPYDIYQNEFLDFSYSVSQRNVYKEFRKKIKDTLDEMHRIIVNVGGKLIEDSDDDGDPSKVYKGQVVSDMTLAEIRLELYRKGYFRKEAKLLKQFEKDSFEQRIIKHYLEDLFYAYFYDEEKRESSDKKLILAVDLDPLWDNMTVGALASKLKILIDTMAAIQSTSLVFFTENKVDTVRVSQLIEEGMLGDNENIKIATEKVDERPSNPLTYMSDRLFISNGPPDRLYILTKGTVKQEHREDFMKKADDRFKSGWDVILL